MCTQELAAAKAEIQQLQEVIDGKDALLLLEMERRQTAEDAFLFVREQTLPLRNSLTELQRSVKLEVTDRSRVLQLNTALCVETMQALAADIKKQFGYVPVHIQNKVDLVSLCYTVWLYLIV